MDETVERRGGLFTCTMKIDGIEREFAIRVTFKAETPTAKIREAFEAAALSGLWTLMYEHAAGYADLDDAAMAELQRNPPPGYHERMSEWTHFGEAVGQ